MKSFITILMLSGLAALPASVLAAEDAYMGDWKGKVTVGSEARDVSVYMIPLGRGQYEARFVSSFEQRGPWLYRLKGRIAGAEGRFLDDIPFTPDHVLGANERGVIVDAALWSGSVTGSRLTGSIQGRTRGKFELAQSARVSPSLNKPAPPGAVILFNGSSLEGWQHREAGKQAAWQLLPGGIMQVNGGDIVSTEVFGDHWLHLEFRLPYMPDAFGQARANSGVYLQSRYEVQVLDSYGLEGADNECGGIYQVAPPAVNMCAPPLQWQSYDIQFHQARVQGGKKTPARITVIHNGVRIHNNVELPKVTGGAISDREGIPAGLMLQDHGNPVQFRNIWAQRLD